MPDIRRGEVLTPFDDRGYSSAAISTDSKLLALIPEKGHTVAVFETDSLREIFRHSAPNAAECVFIPGTATLVFDTQIPAIDVRTGATVAHADVVAGWERSDSPLLPWRASSADGHLRVTEAEPKLHLWLADGTGRRLGRLARGTDPRISRDGERVAMLKLDTLLVWQTSKLDEGPRVLPLRDGSFGLALSPDGEFSITMEGRFAHTYIRRLADGAVVRYGASWHDRGPFDPRCPAWSPDGSFVVVCYRARESGGQGRVEVCRLDSPSG